jgi:hypothetical protein
MDNKLKYIITTNKIGSNAYQRIRPIEKTIPILLFNHNYQT